MESFSPGLEINTSEQIESSCTQTKTKLMYTTDVIEQQDKRYTNLLLTYKYSL